MSWDIKFLKGQSLESVPVSQIVTMETGETFRFSVFPYADAFCYIVSHDSLRKIDVLHSGRLAGSRESFFGPFRLTLPSGTETIYVIMSLEKLSRLERYIKNYNNNPNSRLASSNLHREILNLQNSVSKLGEGISSYVPSGGTTRGSVEEYTTKFSGNNLYVRTISIRH